MIFLPIVVVRRGLRRATIVDDGAVAVNQRRASAVRVLRR